MTKAPKALSEGLNRVDARFRVRTRCPERDVSWPTRLTVAHALPRFQIRHAIGAQIVISIGWLSAGLTQQRCSAPVRLERAVATGETTRLDYARRSDLCVYSGMDQP